MSLRKSSATAALTLAATLLLTGAAVAGGSAGSQGARGGDFEQEIALHASQLGAMLNAQGIAFRARTSGVEKLAVRVFGDFRNGTVLVVEVNKSSGRVLAGSITILLGSGSLQLDSRQGSAVFPVEDIESITVIASEGPVLEGRF